MAMKSSCVILYEILSFLEKKLGMELPGTVKAEELKNSKAGFLAWYAQKVSEDSAFWEKVPHKLPNAFREEIRTRVQLRVHLLENVMEDD